MVYSVFMAIRRARAVTHQVDSRSLAEVRPLMSICQLSFCGESHAVGTSWSPVGSFSANSACGVLNPAHRRLLLERLISFLAQLRCLCCCDSFYLFIVFVDNKIKNTVTLILQRVNLPGVYYNYS